jgi:uncharacterized damage-inducible protein DinB
VVIARTHPLAAQLESLAAMPAFVQAALDRAPREAWKRKPSADAFSLVEQACHLRDVDRDAYVVRVKRMLQEESPRLTGFDGAAVARERAYETQDAWVAAQEFGSARAELIALLGATTPSDLAREATFMDEPVTLERLVAMMMEHDREHRDEIAALGRALEGSEWR